MQDSKTTTSTADDQFIDVVYGSRVKAQIEELRIHMSEQGEQAENPIEDAKLDGEYLFEQKMKLTVKPGDTQMFLVPSDQDWQHDALDDVRIIAGTVYASDEPFLSGTIGIDGYFQADEDGRWVRVTQGAVALDAQGNADWRDELEQFEELVTEYVAAMEVPEYRHVAEQAAMKSMIDNLISK